MLCARSLRLDWRRQCRHHSIAALALGVIDRLVGKPHQRVDVVTERIGRSDADADGGPLEAAWNFDDRLFDLLADSAWAATACHRLCKWMVRPIPVVHLSCWADHAGQTSNCYRAFNGGSRPAGIGGGRRLEFRTQTHRLASEKPVEGTAVALDRNEILKHLRQLGSDDK